MKSMPSSDSDWQRIWLATRQHDWTSLSLIPTDVGLDIDSVADTLLATGRLQNEHPVVLLDARGVELVTVQPFLDTLVKATRTGNWVIVTTDPVASNPSAAVIARATSTALLVVQLGGSRLPSARMALEAVGREHFIGSLVVTGSRENAHATFEVPDQ